MATGWCNWYRQFLWKVWLRDSHAIPVRQRANARNVSFCYLPVHGGNFYSSFQMTVESNYLRQFFNQWDAKPKPIAPCTRDFSRASSELQVIAGNCDWFMELFVPVVIGRSNCFGFGFSTALSTCLIANFSVSIPHRSRTTLSSGNSVCSHDVTAAMLEE